MTAWPFAVSKVSVGQRSICWKLIEHNRFALTFWLRSVFAVLCEMLFSFGHLAWVFGFVVHFAACTCPLTAFDFGLCWSLVTTAWELTVSWATVAAQKVSGVQLVFARVCLNSIVHGCLVQLQLAPVLNNSNNNFLVWKSCVCVCGRGNAVGVCRYAYGQKICIFDYFIWHLKSNLYSWICKLANVRQPHQSLIIKFTFLKNL